MAISSSLEKRDRLARSVSGSSYASVQDNIFTVIVDHVHDIELQAVSEQGIAAAFVDHFPLGIHYIIVFQQPLSYGKVIFFNLLLCTFNGFGDHTVLDHFTFLQPHAVHKLGDPF
jgi:hypothetical protein